MVLAVSHRKAADVTVLRNGQLLGHPHIAELGAVNATVAHTVGLNREGLPWVLAGAEAHAGEVFVLPSALVLVSGKLAIAPLHGTDGPAGIEDGTHQHLTGCAPVPRRQRRKDDVPDLRLYRRWSILCSQQLHGLVIGVPGSAEPAAYLSPLACVRVEPYLP